jgi:hypothetical protein
MVPVVLQLLRRGRRADRGPRDGPLEAEEATRTLRRGRVAVKRTPMLIEYVGLIAIVALALWLYMQAGR